MSSMPRSIQNRRPLALVTPLLLVGLAGLGVGCQSTSSRAGAPVDQTSPTFASQDTTQFAAPAPVSTDGVLVTEPAAASGAEPAGTTLTTTYEQPSMGVTSVGGFSTSSDDGVLTANVSRVTLTDEGADFDPSISPDGTRLVFASTQHRRTSDIYVQRVGSRVVTQLTTDAADDAMPRVSPDGTKVAFASNRGGNWDVFVMPMTGGRAVQITSDAADEIAPSWSPDGTSLVYNRLNPASGRWEMWVVETTNQAVANFIGFGMFPQWSPLAGTGAEGADRILFQSGRERGQRAFAIWTLDYRDGAASNATQIVSGSDFAAINPAWSPDGHWVVFAQAPVGTGEGFGPGRTPSNSELWMINADGTGKVRLTSGSGVAFSPVWARNNRVYFVSSRNGVDNIWSLELGSAVSAAQALQNPASPRVAQQTPVQTAAPSSAPNHAPTHAPVADAEDHGHDE
jgi:Tol biopolymer transport system component